MPSTNVACSTPTRSSTEGRPTPGPPGEPRSPCRVPARPRPAWPRSTQWATRSMPCGSKAMPSTGRASRSSSIGAARRGPHLAGPIQISQRLGSIGAPRVLHAASGHVLVTWTERVSHQIYVRVSPNNGAGFARARLLATTTNEAIPDRELGEGQPTLAAGAGVVYAAYFSAPGTVQLRRSTDFGTTWSEPVTLATNALSSRLGSPPTDPSPCWAGSCAGRATDT